MCKFQSCCFAAGEFVIVAPSALLVLAAVSGGLLFVRLASWPEHLPAKNTVAAASTGQGQK
jgi:hypothetical protein